MSDKFLHDDAQDQSWIGGPDTPRLELYGASDRHGCSDRAHEPIAEPPSRSEAAFDAAAAQGGPGYLQGSQASQESAGDEREAGYRDYYLRLPPLQGASWERLELCRDALALALMDAGIGIRLAKELAARCTARLQEPLDQ